MYINIVAMLYRILYVITLCLTSVHVVAENNPEKIVSSFGKTLSSWCNTREGVDREKIEQLCTGLKSCRVEDKIHAEYQRKQGFLNYETFILDSYLNMFEEYMSQGISFQLSNVNFVHSDMMPDGTLSFVTADVTIKGPINRTVTDLFLIRDEKITGIYSYSSELGFSHLNGSLINALKMGRYTWTDGFRDGYAIVKNEGRHSGLIDSKGNVIIPCMWDAIIYEGGAAFATGIDFDSDLRATYDLRKGGKRVPLYAVDTYLVGNDLKPVAFSDGWATVCNKEGKYGYLKEDWNESEYDKIEYLFETATRFVDGYAYVTYNGYGFILNTDMEVVLHTDDKYHIYSNARDGLVQVLDRSTLKSGYVNLSGELVIPCVYYKAEDFYNGMSLVYSTSVVTTLDEDHVLKGPLGMIDRYGRAILDCNYYASINGMSFSEDGYIILLKKHEDKYLSTLIGRDGKPLPGFTWQHHHILQQLRDGYALFQTDHTVGYYDKKGNIALDLSGKFQLASSFKNGIANVGIIENHVKKYGCINKDGVNFIPCIYDKELRFDTNGIALAIKDGRVSLVDRYGNSAFLF